MKRTTFIPLSLALAASAFADNTFYFNEAGYDSDQPISIVVKSTDNLEGQKWTLWFDPDGGMTGASVATGTFGAGVNPDNWTNNGKFYTIKLTEKPLQSGSFHVEVAAGSPSASQKFFIGDKALAQKTLGMVMDYFYNDRASRQEIVAMDQKIPVYGSGATRDVHGGWYDASGDVSKYLSHLSYANYLGGTYSAVARPDEYQGEDRGRGCLRCGFPGTHARRSGILLHDGVRQLGKPDGQT